MKATEQYFPLVPLIILYNVVLTFESVDEILKCDHSNESYFSTFLWCCLLTNTKVVLNFESEDVLPTHDFSNKSW